MERKIVCLSLVLSFLLIGNLVEAQSVKKNLWIKFNPADTLCVKMGKYDYRFYQYNMRFPYYDFGAPGDIGRYDTIYHIPKKVHFVTRVELFDLMDNLPKTELKPGVFFGDLQTGWYDNAFPVTYIVEKKGCYYLRCKVEKIQIYD